MTRPRSWLVRVLTRLPWTRHTSLLVDRMLVAREANEAKARIAAAARLEAALVLLGEADDLELAYRLVKRAASDIGEVLP